MVLSTLLYLKWTTSQVYCIAQGALLIVMRQPGWEGSLEENGYMYMCGWVALLPTQNYHNIFNWLYSSTKSEQVMAPYSSTLAWKIPWMEEPGGLQSMGSRRVRHDWVISLSRIGEGNGNPLQCSCLENPRDGGAWWAAVYGVAQSQTRLKQLSGSSSSSSRTK